MVTLIVYPDDHPEVSSVDGTISRSSVDEALSTIRAGAGTSVEDNGSSIFVSLLASTTTDQYEALARGFVNFDTSIIPSTATITSVTVEVYGDAKSNGLGDTGLYLDIVTGGTASDTALATGDFGSLGETYLHSIDYATFNTSGYNSYLPDPHNLNLEGITKYGFRISWDTDNSFGGSWTSGLQSGFSFAESVGDASPSPRLTVVYTAVGETTSTFYPDAHTESTSVDGYVRHTGVNVPFTTLRGYAGNGSSDSAAIDVISLRASTTSNQFQSLQREIFLFDTSAISATDIIAQATFSLYGFGGASDLGTTTIDVVSSSPASNTALVNADFTTLGTTVYGDMDYSSWSTSAYNDIPIDSNAVTKAGITKLGTRLGWDTDNSFGGSWSSDAQTRFNFCTADQAGTSNDPKLTVLHYPPAVSSATSARMIGGGMIPG